MTLPLNSNFPMAYETQPTLEYDLSNGSKTQLRETHVAAQRLCTTSSFTRMINTPLRNNNQTNEQEWKPHPFPVTVSFIDDAIQRSRASTEQTFEQKNTFAGELKENTFLWQGIKYTRITEGFLQGRRGVIVGFWNKKQQKRNKMREAIKSSCPLLQALF